MSFTTKNLKNNSKKKREEQQKLLKGRIVKNIRRFRKEVVIDFEDGTKFSIDWQEDELDSSITGNFKEDK